MCASARALVTSRAAVGTPCPSCGLVEGRTPWTLAPEGPASLCFGWCWTALPDQPCGPPGCRQAAGGVGGCQAVAARQRRGGQCHERPCAAPALGRGLQGCCGNRHLQHGKGGSQGELPPASGCPLSPALAQPLFLRRPGPPQGPQLGVTWPPACESTSPGPPLGLSPPQSHWLGHRGQRLPQPCEPPQGRGTQAGPTPGGVPAQRWCVWGCARALPGPVQVQTRWAGCFQRSWWSAGPGSGVAAVRTPRQTQGRTFIAEHKTPTREAWPAASSSGKSPGGGLGVPGRPLPHLQ